MKEQFERIHAFFESTNEKLYKGIQLYYSPLRKAKFLFIGINPGVGFLKANDRLVKRFKPLDKFEYIGFDYQLARQSRNLFSELGLSNDFSKAVKINQYPLQL